jgi:molecular chaperone DnaK (HSP70)
MARVVRAAETAKKQLSDHPFARIQEEYLTGRDGNPVNLDLELSRNDYEEMIAPFIEETLGAIHIALESASLTASQVDEILLVGGATRTPMIRRRLIEAFGNEPRGEVDPDLCVALGAAIQGAAIAGTEVSAVLVDVTPYTFGTSALGERNGDIYPYATFRSFPGTRRSRCEGARFFSLSPTHKPKSMCGYSRARTRMRWKTSSLANSASPGLARPARAIP